MIFDKHVMINTFFLHDILNLLTTVIPHLPRQSWMIQPIVEAMPHNHLNTIISNFESLPWIADMLAFLCYGEILPINQS